LAGPKDLSVRMLRGVSVEILRSANDALLRKTPRYLIGMTSRNVPCVKYARTKLSAWPARKFRSIFRCIRQHQKQRQIVLQIIRDQEIFFYMLVPLLGQPGGNLRMG
jgi:hypothetical protein